MTFGVRWGDGRFANRPYGGDGKGQGTGRGIGWVPACARTRGGEGVPGGEIPRGTRNDIWGALGERAVREPPLREDGGEEFAYAWENGRGCGTGDHEGRPYGGRGRDGEGWVPACARTQGVGTGGSRTAPTGGGEGTGNGDEFVHPRGRGGGWVPAFARTRRGGSTWRRDSLRDSE